ncbi:hypothetical protein NIES2109_47090 [Nostoc sp. HK-01]|nr:hypothetical protein NIES2109_47090 [Nostoc sp. HK-01]
MYKRQHRTGKTPANHSDVPANQFAPRRFVSQPQTEEPEQSPDLQAKSTSTETSGNNFANIPIFPPGYQPPPPPRIQMKLTIGEPGDKYEQEADRLAADVVQRINSPETPPVQPQPKPEEELRKKSLIQRLSDADETSATPDLEASIQRSKGGGQPLAETIKQPMEQAFGADFSGVKIHTDAQSDQMNQSIQAKAFTTGQDIFFRQGNYDPGSRGGQELIAHELTHVVQQNQSRIQTKKDTSQITDVTDSQPSNLLGITIAQDIQGTIRMMPEDKAKNLISKRGDLKWVVENNEIWEKFKQAQGNSWNIEDVPGTKLTKLVEQFAKANENLKPANNKKSSNQSNAKQDDFLTTWLKQNKYNVSLWHTWILKSISREKKVTETLEEVTKACGNEAEVLKKAEYIIKVESEIQGNALEEAANTDILVPEGHYLVKSASDVTSGLATTGLATCTGVALVGKNSGAEVYALCHIDSDTNISATLSAMISDVQAMLKSDDDDQQQSPIPPIEAYIVSPTNDTSKKVVDVFNNESQKGKLKIVYVGQSSGGIRIGATNEQNNAQFSGFHAKHSDQNWLNWDQKPLSVLGKTISSWATELNVMPGNLGTNEVVKHINDGLKSMLEALDKHSQEIGYTKKGRFQVIEESDNINESKQQELTELAEVILTHKDWLNQYDAGSQLVTWAFGLVSDE